MGLPELLQLCDSRPNPVLSEKEISSLLTPQEKTALTKKKIIAQASPASSVLCPECYGHEADVIYRGDVPTVVCSKEDGGISDLEKQEINRVSLIFSEVVDFISGGLRLSQKATEVLSQELWHLGEYFYKSAPFTVFIVAGHLSERQSQLFKQMKSVPRPINNIVCFSTSAKIEDFSKEEKTLIIPLYKLFLLQKKSMVFAKDLIDGFITTHFIGVEFDRERGRLLYNGVELVRVNFGSNEFKFLDILDKNFDFVVDDEAVQKVCGAGERQDTATNFAHKIKSSIKNKSAYPDIVDNIIIRDQTKNGLKGYRLGLP